MSGVARALITGITDQDGSYLAEFLFDTGIRGPRPRPPRLDRELPTAERHAQNEQTRSTRPARTESLRAYGHFITVDYRES
jgi:hypothetical protein